MDETTNQGATGAEVDEKTPAGFSPITTQDEFDAAIRKRLERAERSYEAKYKDVFDKARAYDDMQEANKSELEKANDKVSKLQDELNTLKMRDQVNEWKRAASDKTGVPVDVIRGETEEEIMAHAEALQPHFTASTGFVKSDGFAVASGKTRTNSDLFAEAMKRAN